MKDEKKNAPQNASCPFGCVGVAALAALLLCPYERKKTANGFELRAVLYDFRYEKRGEKRYYIADLFGILSKQAKVLRGILQDAQEDL